MKIVISPAKSLDFENKFNDRDFTQAKFTSEAEELILQLRNLNPKEIEKLMSISAKLAILNYQRFADWSLPFTIENAKQAIFAFTGDVYQGFDVESLNKSELENTQNKLRILSGLYGVLKPLDLIKAYRLEMSSKFANSKGKNLYEFWGDSITDFLNNEMASDNEKVLINLASNEYFKSINNKKLDAKIITPIFKEEKNGQLKIVSFYAKKARGLMCRFIIKNNIESIEDIKAFDCENYCFNETLSNDNDWYFTR